MPDISVIIPAYNRSGLIGETLRSLLNQTLPAKEIIVVDDGSTDGTAEKTLEAFENWKLETGNLKKDGREQFLVKSNIQHPILKILHQANAGPGAARNRGLAEATGEFIHFFDSDDIAAPNKQEVQLRALLETGADIAYGPWVKGRFVNLTTEVTENTEEKAVLRLGKLSSAAFSNPSTSALVRDCENPSPARSASGPAEALDARRWSLDAGSWNFVPEGPVLQARGLPKGDLVKALLTNWSIVPHACLFRRSILEKAGGFPEDISVGEDQLLFLICLLAGARLVHTPETMVYYRVGDDPAKLTATGAPQKRHARDWARFLLKANEEVSSGEKKVLTEAQRRGVFLTTECTTEHLGRGEKEQTKFGPKGEGVGTTELKSTERAQGDAQRICAGAAFSNPSSSKLARDSENTSPTRSASGPDSLPATSYSLLATAPEALTTPSAWFGFRLRAYEAWWDLEKFFPVEENELKNELQGIWKRNWFSGSRFQASGFVLRKLGGLKLRVLGYREHDSFRCGKFSSFIDFGG
jgi:glycosyltransferase involved in cell wall biosynthesis